MNVLSYIVKIYDVWYNVHTIETLYTTNNQDALGKINILL